MSSIGISQLKLTGSSEEWLAFYLENFYDTVYYPLQMLTALHQQDISPDFLEPYLTHRNYFIRSAVREALHELEQQKRQTQLLEQNG